MFFDESYNTNPLVNAFSAGIIDSSKMISAKATGPGNPVFIVGSATGKDGIAGAAFASKDITEDSANDLPSVHQILHRKHHLLHLSSCIMYHFLNHPYHIFE